MTSRLSFIQQRIGLALGSTAEGGGTDVTLTWNEYAGGSRDPVTGQHLAGTTTSGQTATIRGFIHFVEAKSVVRQFSEIEVGDVILDVLPTAAIDGKEALRFTINGEAFEQKEVSQKLTQAWDTLFKNETLMRTLLLKKAT